MLGFSWADSGGAAPAVVGESALQGAAVAADVEFNSFLSISPQGIVTIFSPLVHSIAWPLPPPIIAGP